MALHSALSHPVDWKQVRVKEDEEGTDRKKVLVVVVVWRGDSPVYVYVYYTEAHG